MAAEQPIYRVDERVDGLYDENTDEMWYPGRIRCVHLSEDSNGPTFEVLYDDGEVETHVRPEFLRQHVSGTICVGTRVLCRYDGGEEFYPGEVSDVQENGMYTVAYDDGEVKEGVPLEHIMEPKGGDEGEAAEEDETTDDRASEEAQQQEDIEVEDVQDYPSNPADDAGSATDMPQENEEQHVNEGRKVWDTEPIEQPRAEPFKYDETPQPARQKEDHPEPTRAGVSAERTHIIESLQLLEKRLGDAASTKSVLSTLVKQMRAYPQITADLLDERGGERLIIDSLKFHQTHAVIQCYGFVLLRRLCFLCMKSTQYLLRNGIVELVMQAMNAFGEDAILQASACGALAVFTRVQTGLNSLIEYQVAQLVLSTLTYHKTYSVHTRQVHYYACEVLLELCELDDLQTLNLLCGEQDEDFTGDMSPVSLLLFLLRQGLSLDDKKACCAVGSLLMCLAASGRRAATLILGLNGLAELSTVMARYPTEPSIQKYSAPASKQIALSSVRQSPTKRIKETATEILREAESLENTPRDRQPTKRSVPRGRSTKVGKRKSNPTSGYGAPTYPRGAAYTSATPYRSGQGILKVSSPYGQGTPGFGGGTKYVGYSARDYSTSSTAPQQPSSLVFLDEMDSGFGSTSKRKQISKEDHQSELFDAYGIQGIPNSGNGRPYGTKRSQLKAHLASAGSAWAAPQHHEMRHGSSTTNKPYSSRSDHLDHSSMSSHRDFGQNRWDYGDDEAQNSIYDPELRQNRGAKRKKKTTVPRTAFQVRVENDNQLRVSRETRSSYPSPQRLGVATKRAAKARQKRITGATHPSLPGRVNDTSSESLNDYATQLFQDNAARVGTNIPTTSRLTPREKEEIRERERLSFAEKLHKMIDKAKSTLANGNTSTAPADDAVRPKKVAAISKVVRKTREPPTDEKRPLSKKNRTTVSITPKNTTKEVPSPREAAETRSPNPTSRLSKRRVSSDAQQPAVPRAKPIASRSVVTRKGTTDPKPRAAVKTSKATTPEIVGKHNTEKDNTFAETVPAEVAPVNAIVIEKPHQTEPVAVAAESVVIPAQSTEQGITPSETISAEQVEPSNEVVPVKTGVESADAAPESEVGPATAEPGHENGDVIPSGGENIDQVSGKNASEEEEVVASAPVEVEGVAHSENATPSIDLDPAPDTDDAHTPATGTSVPTTDVLLKESKSGEALYVDGYNEFDDDEATEEAEVEDAPTTETFTAQPSDASAMQANDVVPDPAEMYNEFDDDEATEEAEAEDAPTTEAVNTQPSDAIFMPASDVVPEPAQNALEIEAEHLVAQGDTSSVAAVEEAVSVPTEGEVGHESLERDTNVDDQPVNADVDAPESEDVVNEPEEPHEAQSAVVDDDNAQVDATQNEFDPPEVNAEGESDAGTATNVESNPADGVNSSAEPGDDTHLDPVDSSAGENADGATTLENEANVPGVEKVDDETAPGAEIDDVPPTIEPTEAESAVEISQTDAQAADFDAEAQNADTPGEIVDANDAAAGEMLTGRDNARDDSPENVETNKQPEEPLVANDSSPLLEQDDENSKKLAPDGSDASIQSAGYDEENFDDEEDHQEVGPTEAVEDPVVAPVEEPVEAADKQLQEVDTVEIAEAPDNTATANTAANTSECVEEESKGLAPNSSEVSVQSAAYDDDDFENGEQEESSHEQNTDVSNQVSEKQQTGAVEVIDDEEKVNIDTEAPNADPKSNEDEGFDDTAQDDVPSEVTAESMVAEVTQELPEQQQVEHSDFMFNAESGLDDAASTVTVENEVPVTSKEESNDNVQEPVADEADQYADDLADEVALENVNSSTSPTANIEDPSAPLSAANESPIEPSAESDAPVGEAPEITITAPAEEGALENSATYDDDDFSNDGKEEKSPPSPEDQNTGESLQNCVPDTQPSLEQTSSDISASAPEVADNAEDPATKSEVLPEPEQLAEESTPSPAIEAEPSVVLDTANAFVSDVTIEPESAVRPVVDAVDQAGSPPTADDVGSSIEEAANPGSEVALSEPSNPDDQSSAREGLSRPEDSADPEPESATAAVPAEEVPEPASQSADPVESDNADVVVAATSDETEVITVDTTQGTTAAELPDYTQGDDGCEEDPIPTPADVSVPAETPVEPSTDLKDDETEYEDAGIDDENAAAAATDVVLENEIAQTESGISEEVSSADKSSADEPSSTEVAQVETGIEVHEATEATEDQLAEDAASPATEMQEKVDIPETVVDADDYADDTEGAGDTDTAIETREAVDDTSDNADHDASSTTEGAGVQDAVSIPDATAYDEDFPSESPEAHDNAVMETAASPGEEELISSDDTDDKVESPAVADNEPDAPELGADDSAQISRGSGTAPFLPSNEEQYDDGFDDENTTSNPIDAGNTADATPTTEVGSVGSTDVPENSVVEESQDDRAATESEQLDEGQTGSDEVDLITPESAVQEKNTAEFEESDVGDSDQGPAVAVAEPVVAESASADEVDSEAAESEATLELIDPEAVDTENTPLEPVETEAVDSEFTAPKSVERESVEPAAVEPEPVEPVATESEPVDAAEPSAMEPKPVESDSVEPEVMQSELVESNAVELGSSEVGAVSSEAMLPGVVVDVIEAVELEPGEPASVEQETTDSEVVETEAPTPEAAVSGIEEPEAASEATQKEPLVDPLETQMLADPVTTEDESLSTTEVVETDVDVPTKTSESSPIVEGDANNATEDALAEVDVIDPPQSDESTDNSGSPRVEAPVADDPPDIIEASPEPAAVDCESAPAPEEVSVPSNVEAAAPAYENVGVSDGTIAIDEVARNDSVEDTNEQVEPDAATSESTEPMVSTVEDENPPVEEQIPAQDDYDDDDLTPSESVIATNDSAPDKGEVMNEESSSSQVVTEAATPEESEVQDKVEASEELAIEADPPKPDVEDAAEDQYDDDDGYNDFDDQDTVPAAEPKIESPAPTASTEAPKTEDDYEDYENEDYAEEPAEAPIPEPVEQPISSRSEIEEVADEPEEGEEEAYADDQDEYEEDDTPAPAPYQDPPAPPAEASADEYEDDNEEEEYAEDEVEENTPRPNATAKKPKDEVDYDSDYAESD